MAFPVDWLKKQKITIAAAEVDATLTDQVVLITLDHLDTEIVDGGVDQGTAAAIRFGNIDGTVQYAHEIQRFTSHATLGSRRCMIWVKVPSLSSSVDTDIYIFYQNVAVSEQAVTDTYGRNAVWSDFELVYHLNETSNTGPWINATGGSNNGTLITGSSLPYNETNHPFDDNWPDFNDDHVIEMDATTTTLNGDTTLGLSCWVRTDVDSAANGVWGNSRASDTNFVQIRASGRNTLKVSAEDNATPTTITTANLHLVAVAYDGAASLKAMIDGVVAATDASLTNTAGITSVSDFVVGGLYNLSSPYRFDGRVAECRAFKYLPTVEQHAAEWSNLNTPATFATAGTPEDTSTNASPTGSIVITGSTVQGATLTNTDTIADTDGLGTFTYSWLRDDVVISGATSVTYVLTAFDVTALIKARINYTDDGGTAEEVTSAATAAITGLVQTTYQQCVATITSDASRLTDGTTFTDITIPIHYADIPASMLDGGTGSFVNGAGNFRAYKDAELIDANRIAVKGTLDLTAGTSTIEVLYDSFSVISNEEITIVRVNSDAVQPAAAAQWGADEVTNATPLPNDADLTATLATFVSDPLALTGGSATCETIGAVDTGQSKQGLRHASFNALHGGALRTYNGDVVAGCKADDVTITATTYNGVLGEWLNNKGYSQDTLNGRLNAFAVTKGAEDWNGLGTFTV